MRFSLRFPGALLMIGFECGYQLHGDQKVILLYPNLKRFVPILIFKN